MKGRRFRIFCIFLLALLCVSCSRVTEDEEREKEYITIGFSQVGSESDWRSANSISMRESFSERNGYELFLSEAQQKQDNQFRAIRRFVQQEVDYLVLAPVTETGWDSILREVKRTGIPVVIVDRMVDVEDDSLYTAYVGSDFALEGAKAGEWIYQYLLACNMENANIVNIQGTLGGSAQIGRTMGLREACEKHENMTLLAEESGEYTQAKAQEVMSRFLETYDNINIVYCENDNEAFGAIQAIEQAGLTVGSDIAAGEIMIISFDAVEAGMKLALEGKITLIMECNPLQGPRVESVIKQLEAGEVPDKISFVDEGMYSSVDIVPTVWVDGTEYEVTKITEDIIRGRTY